MLWGHEVHKSFVISKWYIGPELRSSDFSQPTGCVIWGKSLQELLELSFFVIHKFGKLSCVMAFVPSIFTFLFMISEFYIAVTYCDSYIQQKFFSVYSKVRLTWLHLLGPNQNYHSYVAYILDKAQNNQKWSYKILGAQKKIKQSDVIGGVGRAMASLQRRFREGFLDKVIFNL